MTQIISSTIVMFLLLISICVKSQEVQLFEPNKISSHLNERDFSSTPDGKTIYFTVGNFDHSKRCIAFSTWKDNQWSDPQVVSFSGVHNDLEPFVSPDGEKLFFASNRTADGMKQKRDYDLWYVYKVGTGWGTPMVLDSTINSPKNEFYPAVAMNGNLYFTSTRSDSKGTEDIYCSVFQNGTYTKPTSLPEEINTKTYEYNAFINPEENLIIFGSYGRSDDLGGGDLYYSKKNANGKWMEAIHFDSSINSSSLDYCPYYDVKNNKLYFTSNRHDIPTEINDIKEFQEQVKSIKNGFGNIYQIEMKF